MQLDKGKGDPDKDEAAEEAENKPSVAEDEKKDQKVTDGESTKEKLKAKSQKIVV
jgi:hypothetical protein